MTIGQVVDKVNAIIEGLEGEYKVIDLTSNIFSIECETEYQCKNIKGHIFEGTTRSICGRFIVFVLKN